MNGNSNLATFKLTLVEKSEHRRVERDYCCWSGNIWCERRSGARLIVVFEEPGHPVLEVQTRHQVLARRAGMALRQTIAKPLVVSVVKPLLLERPFQIPLGLFHE